MIASDLLVFLFVLFPCASSEDFTLLKSLILFPSSNLPLGFQQNFVNIPHTLTISTKNSINPVSHREYLTWAKFTLTDPPPPLENPRKSPDTYDLHDHPSETPSFTYLENQQVSLTRLDPDIFMLKIEVISSDCLAPVFLLDNNSLVRVDRDGPSVLVHVAEPKSDEHNRFLDFLKFYRQIEDGRKIQLINGFKNNSELYLKVFCFHWKKPVSPKIILELFFDKKSHIDISLGESLISTASFRFFSTKKNKINNSEKSVRLLQPQTNSLKLGRLGLNRPKHNRVQIGHRGHIQRSANQTSESPLTPVGHLQHAR